MLPPSLKGKIPALFESATLQDFPGLRNVGRANTYICGPNGAGKSHLAAAMANEYNLSWCRVPELLIDLQRCMGRFAVHSEAWILDELRQRRGLVLDDLLSGTTSNWALARLHVLLNGRIEDGTITVAVSDKSIDHIKTIDTGLASRLGGFRQIVLSGPDRRRS